MHAHFSGSGPGAQARDGCSVEFYRELPYLGELDDVLSLLPGGADVLELGCGPGRLTRVLIERGARVTAVDNSSQMLAGLPAAATPVLSDIEALALAARFDVVLLASYLINHPEPAVRCAFLDAAQRHLRASGILLLQCHEPDWLRTVTAGTVSSVAGTRFEIERVRRDGPKVAMTVRYDRATGCWRQSFVAEILDDEQMERMLAGAGFADLRWQGARRRWVAARPAFVPA